MTTAPTIQMMLFMMRASRLGKGSNRFEKTIHYTLVHITLAGTNVPCASAHKSKAGLEQGTTTRRAGPNGLFIRTPEADPYVRKRTKGRPYSAS
jgi:hypothetical protein